MTACGSILLKLYHTIRNKLESFLPSEEETSESPLMAVQLSHDDLFPQK